MKFIGQCILSALLLTLTHADQALAFDREWHKAMLGLPGATRTVQYSSKSFGRGEYSVAYTFHKQSEIPFYWLTDPDSPRRDSTKWHKTDIMRLGDLNKADPNPRGYSFFDPISKGPVWKWPYKSNKIIDGLVDQCRTILYINYKFMDTTHLGFKKVASCVARLARSRLPISFVTQYDHKVMKPDTPIQHALAFGYYDVDKKQFKRLVGNLPKGQVCAGPKFKGGQVQPMICVECFDKLEDIKWESKGVACNGQRFSRVTAVLSWLDVYKFLKRATIRDELAIHYVLKSGGAYYVRNSLRVLLKSLKQTGYQY